MATATGNYPSDNSTLANFKSWAMAISSAFGALGWLQTSDTGQVNWSSIGSVPSNNYVYEVWKANDAQAATLPIFLRIEYGYSSSAPRCRVYAGTGSNGSGTLTGGLLTGAPWEVTYEGSNHGGAGYPCFFSGDAGEFRFYLWQGLTSNSSCVLAVERSKDSSGNKTTEYFTVLCANAYTGTANTFQQTIVSPSLVGNRENGVVCLSLTSGSGTGLWNGTVAALPVFPILGKVGNPMLGMMAAVASDTLDGALVSVVSLYGASHNFVVANRGNFANCLGTRTNGSIALAILLRYE